MISENIEELNNCDSNCFSEIGALVNANYLINGNLKNGARYHFSISIWDIKGASYINAIKLKSKKTMKLVSDLEKNGLDALFEFEFQEILNTTLSVSPSKDKIEDVYINCLISLKK